MDEKLWEFKFEIETSTRYHEQRGATLEYLSKVVKSLSIVGSVLAFMAVADWSKLGVGQFNSELWVAIGAIIVAVVNLFDLVFGFDSGARVHRDLYRRFQKLQEQMMRDERNWHENLNEWRADAQGIRVDEPPTYWAVYARSWNQTIARYGAEQNGYLRQVSLLGSLLRNVWQFSPQSFPAVER